MGARNVEEGATIFQVQLRLMKWFKIYYLLDKTEEVMTELFTQFTNTGTDDTDPKKERCNDPIKNLRGSATSK